MRSLGLAALVDKIVQQAVRTVLECIEEVDFLGLDLAVAKRRNWSLKQPFSPPLPGHVRRLNPRFLGVWTGNIHLTSPPHKSHHAYSGIIWELRSFFVVIVTGGGHIAVPQD
jgi:hypothetical protein